MGKLTREEKIDHFKRCEFHRGTKQGECPIVSNNEAELLRENLINPKTN